VSCFEVFCECTNLQNYDDRSACRNHSITSRSTKEEGRMQWMIGSEMERVRLRRSYLDAIVIRFWINSETRRFFAWTLTDIRLDQSQLSSTDLPWKIGSLVIRNLSGNSVPQINSSRKSWSLPLFPSSGEARAPWSWFSWESKRPPSPV